MEALEVGVDVHGGVIEKRLLGGAVGVGVLGQPELLEQIGGRHRGSPGRPARAGGPGAGPGGRHAWGGPGAGGAGGEAGGAGAEGGGGGGWLQLRGPGLSREPGTAGGEAEGLELTWPPPPQGVILLSLSLPLSLSRHAAAPVRLGERCAF